MGPGITFPGLLDISSMAFKIDTSYRKPLNAVNKNIERDSGLAEEIYRQHLQHLGDQAIQALQTSNQPRDSTLSDQISKHATVPPISRTSAAYDSEIMRPPTRAKLSLRTPTGGLSRKVRLRIPKPHAWSSEYSGLEIPELWARKTMFPSCDKPRALSKGDSNPLIGLFLHRLNDSEHNKNKSVETKPELSPTTQRKVRMAKLGIQCFPSSPKPCTLPSESLLAPTADLLSQQKGCPPSSSDHGPSLIQRRMQQRFSSGLRLRELC